MKKSENLLYEQGQFGYHCDPATGTCIQGTQANPGQYPNLTVCQANCAPPTCENNPTLNCYFCLHHPGGQCISFQNYYTYGSGAPGMNPSQAFLNSQVVPDVSNPGVFLSHQGGAIYDNEADCIASGCDPADDFTNPNTPTSAVKPKDTKFTQSLDTPYDREDIDIEIDRAIREEVNRIKQLLK